MNKEELQTMLEDISCNLETDEIEESQYGWMEIQLNKVRDTIPL